MPPTVGYPPAKEGMEDEEGFFTCAVSVQHKETRQVESSSAYSACDSDQGRKVVWPATAATGSKQQQQQQQQQQSGKTFQGTFRQSQNSSQSQQWITNSEEKENCSQQQQSGQRISRSRSRSKNIMERARSFERAAADSRGNSRPVSRSGSCQRREAEEAAWLRDQGPDARPGSRTDVDSRRFEVGRVSTSEWENRIRGSCEQLPTKTPPPRRRELGLAREEATRTPDPPPPPARLVHPPNTLLDFPPPPADQSELSEESVGQLSEENKEHSVKQWVESTGRGEELVQELEKFAYNVAEEVVTSMEQQERKESSGPNTPGSQVPHSIFSAFWDRQTSIPPELQALSNPVTNPEPAPQRAGWAAGQGTQSGGVYFAAPVRSASNERGRELRGPIYCTEAPSRTGMTFQQEERRREEMRRQEELRQEETRRLAEERENAERQRLEDERRRMEEERRLAEEKMRRQEEERRRQDEERKRQEEERRRQEEERRKQEEQRLRQLELKKAEEERRREELARLRQEEEAKRQEEMRLEQELRRQFQMQQQQEQEELRRKELAEQEELRRRQMEQEELRRREAEQRQREEAEQRAAEARQAKQQEARCVTPRLVRTKSFDKPPPLPLPASEQHEEQQASGPDHLNTVRTGQVMEKRNLWAMRSASMERLPATSPAPRRRRLDWGKKEEEDEEVARPGSSLGQAAGAGTGAVRSLSTGFLSKSKSSSALGREEDRHRPRARLATGWTKEQEQERQEAFLRAQEVKTNKVNETVTGWGRGGAGTNSGRTTPVPSRNIGEVHSENKLAKVAADEKNANSWRTGGPEPSVKLVNVTVEKAAGSNQNIHISENAHSQMANFMDRKEEVSVMTKTRTNTMSSVSSCKSMMSTGSSGSRSEMGAPPAPTRSTSHGGKAEGPATTPDVPALPPNIPGDGAPNLGAGPCESAPEEIVPVESGKLPQPDSVEVAKTAPVTAAKSETVLLDQHVENVQVASTTANTTEASSSESVEVAVDAIESVKAVETVETESAKIVSTKRESATVSNSKSESLTTSMRVESALSQKSDNRASVASVRSDMSIPTPSIMSEKATTCEIARSDNCLKPEVTSTAKPDITNIKSEVAAAKTEMTKSTGECKSQFEMSTANKSETVNSKFMDSKQSRVEHVAKSESSSMWVGNGKVGGDPAKMEVGGADFEEEGVQPSPSTQSITSLLSTCSSSALPLPVRNAWYSGTPPPTTPNPTDTPLPILASWYEQPGDRIDKATKKIEQANLKIERAVSNIDEATSKIEQMSLKTTESSIQSVNKSGKDSVKKIVTNAASQQQNSICVESEDTHLASTKEEIRPRIDDSKQEEKATLEQAKKYSDTVIETASKDDSKDTCGDDTKQKLNDMFDELVSEQNTLEILESSEKSSTVRRNNQVQNKNILLAADEPDNKSVKSDTTVIENKDTAAVEVNGSAGSVLVVPQSPREIRKLFQQPDAFQKPIARTAEAEFGGEMGAGLRGKVRQSKDAFRRQAEADMEVKMEVVEPRLEVPPSPREARRKFQSGTSDSREEEVARTQEMKQAKMQELEAVRASRAAVEHVAFLGQQVTSAGAMEMQERKQELVMLASRRHEDQDLPECPEDRELALRQERNRELAALAGRTAETAPKEEPAGRERQEREERSRELAAVAGRSMEHVEWSAGGDREMELREERQRELQELAQRKLELPVQEGETKEQELRAARARELADLARRPTASPQLVAASEQLDEVTEELRQIAEMETSRSEHRVPTPEVTEDEMRSRVRSTAASWKEREQNAERAEKETATTPTPTRRIGSLFRRDPDYWKLSGSQEELPPPAGDLLEPPPPPRQSSRGKVDEYRAPWRKS